MGYYSTVHGTIKITPPLVTEDLATFDRDNFYELTLSDDGRFLDADHESYKAYYLEEKVRELVANYSGYQFSGILEVYGEDNTDIWRLVIDSDGVRHEEAKVMWPDGTEAESRY
jgi:hypothetical protein